MQQKQFNTVSPKAKHNNWIDLSNKETLKGFMSHEDSKEVTACAFMDWLIILIDCRIALK